AHRERAVSSNPEVRILPPQPASAVSPIRFPAVRELPTFPRVMLVCTSLWLANSGLSALDWWLWRRQSLLAIFQFPFRNARDRFDIEGDWLEGGNAMRGETKASGA